VLRGERLHQQEGRAGVDGPVGVEHLGGQVAEGPIAARSGVVADEDVQMAELRHSSMHGSLGSTVLSQINRKVDDALAGVSTIRVELLHHCLQVVPTPRLVQVMRPMVRHEHVSPASDQPRRNREPNPLPTTDPRHECRSSSK